MASWAGQSYPLKVAVMSWDLGSLSTWTLWGQEQSRSSRRWSWYLCQWPGTSLRGPESGAVSRLA